MTGLVFRAWTGGRVETVQRWLGWFDDRGLVERYPPVAVMGAMIQAMMGNPAATERWADAAEHSMPARRRHARRLLGAGRALPARDPAERLGQGRRPGRAALAIVTAGRLDDYIMSPLVHVAAARTALHSRAAPTAREHLARAARDRCSPPRSR